MKGVRDKKNVEHLKKPLVTCRDFNWSSSSELQNTENHLNEFPQFSQKWCYLVPFWV